MTVGDPKKRKGLVEFLKDVAPGKLQPWQEEMVKELEKYRAGKPDIFGLDLVADPSLPPGQVVMVPDPAINPNLYPVWKTGGRGGGKSAMQKVIQQQYQQHILGSFVPPGLGPGPTSPAPSSPLPRYTARGVREVRVPLGARCMSTYWGWVNNPYTNPQAGVLPPASMHPDYECSLPQGHDRMMMHGHYRDHNLVDGKLEAEWGAPILRSLPPAGFFPGGVDLEVVSHQASAPSQVAFNGPAPSFDGKTYQVGTKPLSDYPDASVPDCFKPSYAPAHRCGAMHTQHRLECSLPSGTKHPVDKNNLPVHEFHPFHNLGEPCAFKWVRDPLDLKASAMARLFPGWEPDSGSSDYDLLPDVKDGEKLPTLADILLEEDERFGRHR